MATWRRWTAGAATAGALVGVAATSGVVALAQRFVDELSRPGATFDEEAAGWAGWAVPHAVAEPPLDRRRGVTFSVPGGPLLRGEFWAQPHPAPTMVICHGYRVDRARLRPVAALEYAQGYNTFLFDFRGHGESAQIATSGGNAEVHDLTAALEVAAEQPETLPGKLFIHGFSMGAAVALLTPPHPDVAGIIADSPYARLDEILCRLVTWQLTAKSATWTPPLRWLRAGFPAVAKATCATSDLVFRLRHHHALLARTDTKVRHWKRRGYRAMHERQAPHPPILLIHALRDPFIPVDHALRIALAAQAGEVPLDLHFADCAVHCGAYGADPERYSAMVRRFVARACTNRDEASDMPALSPAALAHEPRGA
jgi:alpha-beta hydrolase superfamily lysophospholipase